MKALRRVLIGGLAVASVLLLAALGALLSAPLWINTNAVKNEIASLVFRATGDLVQLDRLRLRMFPPVSVEIARPRYSVSGIADIAAESVTIDLDLWRLISGRVQPRGIRLTGAQATIHLPAAGRGTEPFSLATADQQLREVVARITGAAPNLLVAVNDAVIALHFPGQPPLTLRNIHVRMQTSAGKLDGELACASDIWERMSLTFSLASDDLTGSGRLEFVGLQAGRLDGLLGGAAHRPHIEAEVLGRIDWQMRGLARMHVEGIASSPRILLRRNGAAQTFDGVNLAAGLETRGTATELHIHDLYVRAPHLLLSVKLSREERGRHALDVQASGVDLPALQAAAQNLVPEIPWISNPPISLLAGTLTALELRSSAEGFPQLFDLSLLQGEAAVEGVAFALARPAVRLTAAEGRATLDHGELRVQNVKAVLGKSVLRNGKLATNLLDHSASLQAEAVAALDLKETLALARKAIAQRDIRSHLDRVKKIEGTALAHIALSGNPQSLRTVIDVSELSFSVRHRDVPLPIRVSGGRIIYADNGITIGEASGEIGQSSFSGLGASLKLAPPYRFALSQRIAQLSLDELFPLAAARPDLAAALSEVDTLTGTVALSNLRAEGSFRALQATHFHTVASPRNVKIRARRFDHEARIDGGSVGVSERRIEAKRVAMTAMDSELEVSGLSEDYRSGIAALSTTVNGQLGPDTLAWVYRTASTPRAFQVRAPLRFKDADIAWKQSGEISFNGRVKVAGSTDLSIDAHKTAGSMKFDRVTLKDRPSDATLSGVLAGRLLKASFKGKLSGDTLASVFVQPPLSMDVLEGDILVDVDLEKPAGMHAKGRLQGMAITIPGVLAGPVSLECFVLTADGAEITVSETVLSNGENRIDLKGKIRHEDKKFVVDADLRSEKIVLPKSFMDSKPETDNSRQEFKLTDLPVSGRIGVNIQRLETDKLTIAPLVAEARLAGAKLDLNVSEAALCGITLFGNMAGEIEDLQLVGTLSARNADLAQSVPCLTGNRIESSGRMDVDAQFTARGAFETLDEHLEGQFSLVSRDGNIQKFETLNKVFSLLNVTEAARGKRLAVTAAGLPYRIARAKGTLTGKAIHFDEVMLDAPTVHVAATGRVDVGTGKLAMDVMVAPLQTANAIVDKIPLLGRIFGGSVLALPVQVIGTMEDPIIVPLGPGAVAARMTSIIANTLRLPVDAIKTLAPKTDGSANMQDADKK